MCGNENSKVAHTLRLRLILLTLESFKYPHMLQPVRHIYKYTFKRLLPSNHKKKTFTTRSGAVFSNLTWAISYLESNYCLDISLLRCKWYSPTFLTLRSPQNST